ncbi:hypothetical protein [Sinorhizobium sp. BG8]|uniref:hypothetical protein n=1 Tax=Sinorhizobium sp. BG8 TaxID=2613773 RepID=UPI00193D1446|nr:hypothetical protein [Sinorhizobium sp. BG8]QRM55168.1 hypothetical protein F3Y30_11945 [Sinorhizobium sp. BG8]
MQSIPSPHQTDIHCRSLDCEEAIEAAFQELIWRAMQAGWNEEEACQAIASLADNHILAMNANAETDAAIRKAIEKQR